MLTSSASQYLHPGDYLQPLPTTLDAKKSPLALLAQTCSSIGKDSGPSKPIIPPIEKKDKDLQKDKEGCKSESPSARSSTSEGGRRSQGVSDKREGLSPASKDGGSKSSFRTPPPKDIPPLVPISKSSDSRKTPTSSSDSKPLAASTSPSMSSNSASAPSSSGLHSSNSRISLNCGNLSLEVNHQELVSQSMAKSSSHPSLPSVAGALKHDSLASHGLLPPAYSQLPLLGHPLPPMDAASAAAHYPSLAHSALSSLSAQQHHKHGISPYVRYTTVKTAAGATTLVPVCSDPYCTHCKLTLSSAQLTSSAGACGAGCTQCNHDKMPPTSLSLPGLAGLHGLYSSAHSSAVPGLTSSLYPHAFGVLPGAHHGLPYICNWVAGSDYCGKRFATSEELLQHLRSHTASSDAAASGLPPGLPYGFGLGAAALAGCHTPGSLSPNSALRQAYSRSLSPNSLLAAARYHPYAKSPLSASSLPTPGASQPPGIPPYLSAYYPYAAALYGQRLGAVAP